MPEYEEKFTDWGNKVEEIFRVGLKGTVRHLDGRKEKRGDILGVFRELSASLTPEAELWVFLIGHGNYDGRHYKFNIAGPDLTDQDLRTFLDAVGEARTFLIAATGASGILASELSGKNRVIVTATKSPFQRQPPLFLSFFLEAATSAEADTDKNGKVSLLEAYLFSQKKVASWFTEKGRIQTEHSLLDDRSQMRLGNKKGASQSFQSGEGFLASTAYLSTPPQKAYRSLEARQLARKRVRIEREIEDLKNRKKDLLEAKYYEELQQLLVKLAILDEQIRELEDEP